MSTFDLWTSLQTPDGETGKPDTEDSEMNSDGLPSCAVCLCAYEEGEMMRRLPCNHEFHLKCIDQWLTQRITCPMCRVALVSEEQTETPGHVEQGARSPPASPPGSINMEPVERHDIELARVAVASSSTAQASTSSTSILPGTHGEYDVIVVSNVSSEDGQPHTR